MNSYKKQYECFVHQNEDSKEHDPSYHHLKSCLSKYDEDHEDENDNPLHDLEFETASVNNSYHRQMKKSIHCNWDLVITLP